MSTIASPRETPILPLRRLPPSTPTSSGRPSFETTRSGIASPEPASSAALPPLPPLPPTSKRANRAALREFYKLRAPRIAIGGSEVPAGDLDDPDFNADDYVARVVDNSGLEDVLRLYTRVVGELRALDAEKKALVYDNYSKLITATETIRKVSRTGRQMTKGKGERKKKRKEKSCSIAIYSPLPFCPGLDVVYMYMFTCLYEKTRHERKTKQSKY